MEDVCFDLGFIAGIQRGFIDNKDQLEEDLSAFIAILGDNKNSTLVENYSVHDSAFSSNVDSVGRFGSLRPTGLRVVDRCGRAVPGRHWSWVEREGVVEREEIASIATIAEDAKLIKSSKVSCRT